jgi:hypothetical protein
VKQASGQEPVPVTDIPDDITPDELDALSALAAKLNSRSKAGAKSRFGRSTWRRRLKLRQSPSGRRSKSSRAESNQLRPKRLPVRWQRSNSKKLRLQKIGLPKNPQRQWKR